MITYAKLEELMPEAFRRYSGVTPKTFEVTLKVLEQAEGQKKAGRPRKLSLGDQLLMSLTYSENIARSFLAASYGVHKNTATRMIRKLEDARSTADRFNLPQR